MQEPRFKRISITYYKENWPEPWLATIEDFLYEHGGHPHGHARTPERALGIALHEARYALRKQARQARRASHDRSRGR